jgi:hypothetical protein
MPHVLGVADRLQSVAESYTQLFTSVLQLQLQYGAHAPPRHCCVLQTTPKELLFWSHSMQCKIDDVAAGLGLYKIKIMGRHGPCCMFASTPEMPAKQQAGVMFTAAQRLSSMLAEVSAVVASRTACIWQ